jgi:hypothetical protein
MVTFSTMVPNMSCISCMVVAMVMRIGREGWGVGNNDVDGGWLWIPNIRVLDQRNRIGGRPAVGRSLRRARRIIPTCLSITNYAFTFYRWRRLKD